MSLKVIFEHLLFKYLGLRLEAFYLKDFRRFIGFNLERRVTKNNNLP